VKFLHCADLHLDSPMRGLARHEGAPVEALRGATRCAFERAVDLATDEGVGAVVVVGDLYDGNRDDYQTAAFLQRQLHRLRDAGVRVVITYGNHDAENEITRRLSVPDNTRVFPSTAADTVRLEEIGIAFHGRSYATRIVDEDLSLEYPAPVHGLLNVGVLHTSLDGRPHHARYAPCTLDGLVRRGYAYWALGHVHQREEVQRDGVTVVFPGNICGRDIGETGSKGATLVEYDGDIVTGVTHHELAPVRWHHVELDVRDAASVAEVTEAVLSRLAEVRATAPTALHAVGLTVRVGSGAHRQWVRDSEQCEARLRADAAGGDAGIWLERVVVQPADDGPAGVTGDALAAVADTLKGLRDEESGRRKVGELLAGVRSRFGAEREMAVNLGAIGLDDASFATLVAAAEALLGAELEAGA
jgi:DNA repair protein SbcD/Mre11